jgi:RNA polymerase sigma-70 factor (ECF subfamily)
MATIDTQAQDRIDMERLAAGQDSALNELMERHSGPIYQFLFRMLNNEEDAHDLAQETFVRIYQHRDKFDLRTKFTTWMYTIASNLARNQYRWRARHPTISLESENDSGSDLASTTPSTEPGPAARAEAAETNIAVRHAVQELPPDLRAVVVLCEWEELSAMEAADVLQTSARGVESRLYRARKLLKQSLSKWLEQ